MTSFWLPILQKKTLLDKYYSVFDVGEQVACLMDENSEDGVILGAIYTALDEVPASIEEQHLIKFSDGTPFNFANVSTSIQVFSVCMLFNMLFFIEFSFELLDVRLNVLKLELY